MELYEFSRRRYGLEKPAENYLLLSVRILPFLLAFIADPRSLTFLLPMFFVVFAFYSAIYFGSRTSIFLLFVILVSQILSELYIIDPFRPPDKQWDVDLFFLVYKVMNALLVWLIAFFWKQDRLSWLQNQELTDNLRSTQKQLRLYAEQVAETVVLEERNRLARDIHDSLGHNLTAASIQLTKAESFFRRDPDTAMKALTDARGCIQEGMRDIREVLASLSAKGEGFDIFAQIRRILERLPSERFSTKVCLEGNQHDFNRAVLLAVYRLVQEGITNILKHSGADQVEVMVMLGEDRLSAVVQDNGCGFDPSTQERDSSAGLGLEGLRERIGLVRGTFHVFAVPGEGTRLEAEIPREPSSHIGGDAYAG